MRALTIVLGVILATLAATQVSAAPMCLAGRGLASEDGKVYSCRILASGGPFFGQSATSKTQAKEIAREKCGNKQIDEYLDARGSIPDEVIGELSTACINKECE